MDYIVTSSSYSHVAFIFSGPIWMPINYLALGALKHYSLLEDCPHRERAGKLYHQLRNNLMRTVLTEYDRSGYFWEIYDDSTGKGMRGHPFSGRQAVLNYSYYLGCWSDRFICITLSLPAGWTTLVVNIMAEYY